MEPIFIHVLILNQNPIPTFLILAKFKSYKRY